MNRLHRSILNAASAALVMTALVTPLLAMAGMTIDGKPKVTFFASGSPGFLDIEGETNTMTLADDGTKLTFTVPMTTVKTGIDMRDEHMNEKYVEVGTYPNAILSFAKADIKWPVNVGESSTGTVASTFNVHGKDQPVSVSYTVSKTKTGYRVKAKFNYDAAASGIAIPDYMGITVDPKQRAEVSLDLAGS